MFSTYFNFSKPLFHSSPPGSLSSSHLSPPFIPPPPKQHMAARLPPPAHSARRPSPFIPSPPSHSPSPPLSPPLPSLPSGGEIHARPAGRRGSSTAGRRGSSVRDIHARELDHDHRGSLTAAGAGARRLRPDPRRGGRHTGRLRRPFPFPLCSFPLRRERQVRRRRERRDLVRCHANRPL